LLLNGDREKSTFIAPCLPSLADCPPSGAGWIHEIKHDGFRLLACRGAVGIRLLTRNGNDFTARYPLIVEAVEALPVRSCVIDGEAVACDGDGLSIFEKLRWRHHDGHVFMWAFDLIELNGQDMRREPLEVRKATLASVLRSCRAGLQFNQHLEHPGDIVFRHACKRAWRASSRSGWGRVTSAAGRATGSSSKIRMRQRSTASSRRTGEGRGGGDWGWTGRNPHPCLSLRDLGGGRPRGQIVWGGPLCSDGVRFVTA
jgi:bifunctional non-homologous end joining protein LigD